MRLVRSEPQRALALSAGSAPGSRVQVAREVQRLFGNQRMLAMRAVADPTVAGAAAGVTAAAPRPAGNPLVGLKRGDGQGARKDHQDRVTALQEQLNAKVGDQLDAPLVVDGIFGPKTAQALSTFQVQSTIAPREPVDVATADALLDRTPTPEPGRDEVQPGNEIPVRDQLLAASTSMAVAGQLLQLQAAQLIKQAGVDMLGTVFTRPAAPQISAQLTATGGLLEQSGNALLQASVLMAADAQNPGSGFQPSGDNPIFGLKRGDGLVPGTNKDRPRVQQLQEKLNERMSTQLVIDGKFGPRTGEALRDFQRSIRVSVAERVDGVSAEALITGSMPLIPVVAGGLSTTVAGQLQLTAGSPLTTAGDLLATDPNTSATAGLFVSASGTQLTQAGTNLLQAGADMQTSTDRDKTEAVATSLGTASAVLGGAGNLLTQGGALLPEAAGAGLSLAGVGLQGVATNLSSAAAAISTVGGFMRPAS